MPTIDNTVSCNPGVGHHPYDDAQRTMMKSAIGKAKSAWSSLHLTLGLRILVWLFYSAVGGFGLALLEVLVAGFIQLFLVALNLGNTEGLPRFLREYTLSINEICVGLILIGFARFFGQLITSQSATAAQEGLNYRLRTIATYDMLLNPDNNFVSSASTMFRISELFPKSCKWFSSLFMSASKAIECMTLFASMLFLAWRESLFLSLGLVALGVIVLQINRIVRKSGRDIPIEQAKIIRSIELISRNWLLVKLLRTEAREFHSLQKNISRYSSKTMMANAVVNGSTALSQLLGIFLIVSLILSTTYFFHTAGAVLISFLYILGRFVQNLATLAAHAGTMTFYWSPVCQTVHYIDSIGPETIGKLESKVDSIGFFGKRRIHAGRLSLDEHGEGGDVTATGGCLAPDIEFRQVCFQYNTDTEIPSLEGLDLRIPAGTQFGIKGPSGCGKSTLLALLLGFLKPNSGDILILGQRATSYYDNPARRPRVGYVGAEPFLIEGSIFDNLHYGAIERYSEEECWWALTQARLADDVKKLPNQLKYSLKENGMGLSAGQKQRLSLARALITKPELLVLDEASANLDMHTEQQIAETINGLPYLCTRVIVSHRPGLLQYCDQLLDLGAVKSRGE